MQDKHVFLNKIKTTCHFISCMHDNETTMRVELGIVLNVIDEVKEQLKEQDYITCMNVLRDANKIILAHERRVCDLWGAYYKLRDETDFYELLLDFIGSKNIEVPNSFHRDTKNLSNATDYLCDLDDSDESHDRIDDNVIRHLNNLERIKRKYERFMQVDHPELIDEAAMHIIMHSCYNDFEFCGRTFEVPDP